eukprot:8702626-Alexandrium_andersonii.AAC.1
MHVQFVVRARCLLRLSLFGVLSSVSSGASGTQGLPSQACGADDGRPCSPKWGHAQARDWTE